MRKILLAIILFAVAPELSFSATVEYKNFYDLSAFTLGVRAAELNAIPDSELQLISGTWQRDGYAILSIPIKLSENFSTHFSFRITNNVGKGDEDGSGADWLVFNMQTDLNPPGGKAVSIEYDIFNNGARDDNSGNHVGINIDHNFDSIATQPVASRLNDGDIWHTWIEYNNTLLKIFISIDDKKPINPILSYPIDILTHIGTPFVYLGFHAASGAYGADFSVLDWEFISQPAVPDPIIEVDIDIKPGSDLNSINPKSMGKIPVAILSTKDFNAPKMVDRESLTFGATGDEDSLAFCDKPKDVNGDHLKDLVCHFYTQDAGFQCGDTEGILKGETVDGTPIEGSDSVRINPCKK